MTTNVQASERHAATRSRMITWRDPARARFAMRPYDGLERLRAIKRGDVAPPPAAELIGMTIDDVERGRVVFSVVAHEIHENPMGTMHGGIIATLADTAMGCAVSSLLPAGASFTTLELSTRFLRAITQATGVVHCEGVVVHAGGRVATAEARVYDDAGTLYAHATSTCYIDRGTR